MQVGEKKVRKMEALAHEDMESEGDVSYRQWDNPGDGSKQERADFLHLRK